MLKKEVKELFDDKGIYFNENLIESGNYLFDLTVQLNGENREKDRERLFLSKNYASEFGGELKGMEINNKCIVFWNYYMIWTVDLNGLCLCQKPSIIPFEVDADDESIFIDRIKSGGHGNKITIVISESQDMENYILWDLKKSCEIQSFRFQFGGRVFHSDDGKVFIQGKDRVQFCDQGCAIKSY